MGLYLTKTITILAWIFKLVRMQMGPHRVGDLCICKLFPD